GLDHAAKLHLTPAAADDRRAEGGHEVSGLLTERSLRVVQGSNLREEGSVRLHACALELLDASADLVEGLLDRPDELLHGLPPLLELGACLGPVGLALGGRQPEHVVLRAAN